MAQEITQQTHQWLVADRLSATQLQLFVAEVEGTSLSSSATAGSCSLAGQLRRLLFVLTLTGTVVHESLRSLNVARVDPESTDRDFTAASAMRLFAGRYIVGLIVINSLALVVGQIAFFEVIWMAESLDYSVVLTTLVMAAVQATIQFVAAASVPRIYTLSRKESRLHLRGLVHFSILANVASAVIALVAYPIIGTLLVLNGSSTGLFFSLAVVQTLQFSFVGELGTQAFEMSTPHLLATFEGRSDPSHESLIYRKYKCT